MKIGDNGNSKAVDKSREIEIARIETIASRSNITITPPPCRDEPRRQSSYSAGESDDEDELQRTMQSLLEQEEVVLDVMMKNIKVNNNAII
jgi:hypothetical protein